MKRFFTLCCLILLLAHSVGAQQLKESDTVELNGLAVSYRVTNKETVTIDKAQFDRYKVTGSVKNVSGKSMNIRLSTYPALAELGAGRLVEFNCLNATGAKLTSKKITVSMKEHSIRVTYPSRDKDGKFINLFMNVTAGYYLNDGESNEVNAIFIVPQGEELKITAHALK